MPTANNTAPAGAPSSTVTLATTREEFENLIGELSAATCIVGSIGEAAHNTAPYHCGALLRAVKMMEWVASELDAAMTAQEATSPN